MSPQLPCACLVVSCEFLITVPLRSTTFTTQEDIEIPFMGVREAFFSNNWGSLGEVVCQNA